MLEYAQEISERNSSDRDYYMAQIVSWINYEGHNSKMIVSAHNDHVVILLFKIEKMKTPREWGII